MLSCDESGIKITINFCSKTLEMARKAGIVRNVKETDRNLAEAGMSLEELREQNKRLTIEKGLELFIKNGVDQTTVNDLRAVDCKRGGRQGSTVAEMAGFNLKP